MEPEDYKVAAIVHWRKRSAIEVMAEKWIPHLDTYHIKTRADSEGRVVNVKPVGDPEILEARRTIGLAYTHESEPSAKEIIKNMPQRANAYCLGEIVQVGRGGGGPTWCTIQYHRISQQVFLAELRKARKKSSKK